MKDHRSLTIPGCNEDEDDADSDHSSNDFNFAPSGRCSHHSGLDLCGKEKECTFISELTKDYIEEFNFISFKKQFESLEGDSLGTLTKHSKHSKHSKATKHKKKLSDWTKSVQQKVFNFTTSNSTSILDLNHQKDLFQKKIMSTSMTSFLKLTLVGDGGVGKSCLILQYMYGDFVEEYEPTKADAYRRTITLQGDEVQIDILDTAGQEDYPAVRDGYLKHGDGFLIVFDLTNKETYESIKNHRDNVLRVKLDDPNLPVILIGNKSDLESSRRISYEEAQTLAHSWNIPYIETSAKTRENVDKAFSEIFVKIKELKAERARISGVAGKSKPTYYNNQMTKEEEEAVRADSTRKRIQKWCKNAKKRCFLS